MGECALKVENRIGVVMIFCLATLATILFVYGLYSEVIHDDMIEFINKVEHEIEILPKEVSKNLLAKAKISVLGTCFKTKQVSFKE